MINYDTRSLALGDTGTPVTTVEFDFLVTKRSDVLLSIVQTGVATITFRGDNATYLSDLTFDPVLGGGTVTLLTGIITGQTLYIDLDVQSPDQPNAFRLVSNYLTSFRAIEQALDYVVTQIQTLARWSERSVRLPRHADISLFNPELPEDIVGDADKLLITNIDGDGLDTSTTTLTSLLAGYATAVTAAAAAAVSAAAALASQLAAAVSAAAALVSETNAAASAAAAAATAGALTGTIVVDLFTGDDVTTVFNLSVDPGTIVNTDVYISGVYQQKATYTLVGQVLTFSAAPPTETANNIEVVMSAQLAGVPSDASVTTAKMSYNMRSMTAVGAALITDDTILADPDLGSFIVTFPPVGTVPAGQDLTIINIGVGANYVRLQGNGAELINGNNVFATDLLAGDAATFRSTNSTWYRVG